MYNSDDYFGINPLDIYDVPVDLRPRPVAGGGAAGDNSVLSRSGNYDVKPMPVSPVVFGMAKDIRSLASMSILNRGLIGRSVVVGSSPAPIIECKEERGYLILNPSQVGGTSVVSGTIFNNLSISDISSYPIVSSAVACDPYNEIAFFLNITVSGSAELDFRLESNGLLTGFVDVMSIFSVNESGSYYNKIGTAGVDELFRVSIYNITASPFSAVVDLSFTMKGSGGLSTSGTSVFIGGPGVSSESGYPILPGMEKSFFIKENVILYATTAVGASPVAVKIFEI